MAAEHQQQQPAVAGGGGSRFAVTCGLLRQYMKEQGGCLAPAVAMGLVPGADAAAEEEEERKKPVLELFPQQAGTLKDELRRKRKKEEEEPEETRAPAPAPLTIFYGGRMVVFDDFPAEKAEEIMMHLAGSGNAAAAGTNALGQPSSLTDMPIARKASLKRFLEKRKNRITAGDPYPAAAATTEATKPAAVKLEEGAPWLGVNSALSLT